MHLLDSWAHGFTPSSKCSVLAVRHGFQKDIFRIVSHSRAPPTEDEGAYLLAAALFETLLVEPGQKSSCTQLLRNALKEFEPEVSLYTLVRK